MMSKFAVKANLPQNADIVLLGEKYRGRLDSVLCKMGMRPVYVPDNPFADRRLSGHADLSVIHFGGNSLALAPFLKNTEFSEKLSALGAELVFPGIHMSSQYPFDAMLNICICGERFFYNPKTADGFCVEIMKSKGFEGLAVKQGYSRCAVCVVDENAIITSDCGIHSAAVKAGFDSLLISEGNIELEGFPCGFLGGSSFKIETGKLAFTGNINTHPEGRAMTEFIEKRGIEPVFLTDNRLFDIGSVQPLTER